MITQHRDPLTGRDRLIIQQIIKRVDNHDIPTQNILSIRVNDLGEVDGQIVKTVVVVTKHSLYSFGFDYFKQLAQEIRWSLGLEDIEEVKRKSGTNSRAIWKAINKASLQYALSEIASNEIVQLFSQDVIGFIPSHFQVEEKWYHSVLMATLDNVYAIDRERFDELRDKYESAVFDLA